MPIGCRANPVRGAEALDIAFSVHFVLLTSSQLFSALRICSCSVRGTFPLRKHRFWCICYLSKTFKNTFLCEISVLFWQPCDFAHLLSLKNTFCARLPSKTATWSCENDALVRDILKTSSNTASWSCDTETVLPSLPSKRGGPSFFTHISCLGQERRMCISDWLSDEYCRWTNPMF